MVLHWKKIAFVTLIFVLFQNFTTAPDLLNSTNEYKPLCSEAVRQGFFSSSANSINLTCSLYLKANETLNKNITIKGQENSNIFVRCEKGAKINGMVRVVSAKVDKVSGNPLPAEADPASAVWSAPQNVEVQGCATAGFRVSGIKSVGESHSDDMRYSSYFENHTQNAQDSAPKNIRFINNIITSSGPVPVYFDMGVTQIIFKNNTLNGVTKNVVMYLDAESSHITVEDNVFNVSSIISSDNDSSRLRETIAIDGSANNKILRNKFLGRNFGSIHIYRNCGEKGLVRHQLPQGNLIQGNEFKGSVAQANDIMVDPRSTKLSDTDSFCWQDKNIDLNKLYDVIKRQLPNYLSDYPDKYSIYMKKFDDLPLEIRTLIENAPVYPFGSSLNNSGQVANNTIVDNFLSKPVSGELDILKANTISNNIVEVAGSCKKNQSNEGCQFELKCPEGMVARNVKAACNLEWGGVSDEKFAASPENRIKIIVDSGDAKNRSCSVNGIKAKVMSNPLDQLLGQSQFVFACRDFEAGGGDCAIKARLKCTD